MQERKQKTVKKQQKLSNGFSHIGSKISMIGFRGTDTRSKLNSKDSELRQFRKSKAKFNTLSMIGNVGMEEQLRKEVVQSGQALRECDKQLGQCRVGRSEKEQLFEMEEVIKGKDQMIAKLAKQITLIKESDKNIPEEEESEGSNQQVNRNSSDKEKLFKMAIIMKKNREELAKELNNFVKAHQEYIRIKIEIDQIQEKQKQKQVQREDGYLGNALITFEEFKQREREKRKKDETPTHPRKLQHYSTQPTSKNQTQITSKNMKDLLNRKKITKNAIKNAKVKHDVQMSELYAKLQFLQDEDNHLNDKIKEKKEQLQKMEEKFSARKVEKHRMERTAILEYHS